MWLLIPAAIAAFLLRTVMIARRLRVAAENPSPADLRAFRQAKDSLRAHREHLEEAVAGTKQHLRQARRVSAPLRPTLPTSALRDGEESEGLGAARET